MNIRLTKVPYMCPVIEDHTGNANGHYIFTEVWAGAEIDLDVESEDDMFWRGKIKTYYNGKPGGWLRVELLKEVFEVIEG